MAVVNQPGKYEPSEFQTGMLDCCDDIGICCFGYFCFCCLGCSIASDMGECCLCGLGMPIRSVYRTKYNIKAMIWRCSTLCRKNSFRSFGSMCNDYMVTMCCPLCTTCQLKRDINRRKEQGIF